MSIISCAGVLLNWRRPKNVSKILAGWQVAGLAQGIVWNNNPETQLPAHPWAKVINTRSDFGLYTRFAAACLAQYDCVLIQDDDIELPPDSIRQLFEFWKNDPTILHGIFSRKPKPDGSYAIFGKGEEEVPIVLTRILMTHRRYAADFFHHLPHFSDIQKVCQPFGNGEDIIFSYIARLGANGRLHKTYDLPVIELPAPHAIHHSNPEQHVLHRTKLMRACEEWLCKMQSSARPRLKPQKF
jgi:hypothetical protein